MRSLVSFASPPTRALGRARSAVSVGQRHRPEPAAPLLCYNLCMSAYLPVARWGRTLYGLQCGRCSQRHVVSYAHSITGRTVALFGHRQCR